MRKLRKPEKTCQGMTCLRINLTRKDFKTPMSGCWALLLFLMIIPSRSLGRCFKFILMLPNKNLLSPPLGKWALTREESINILGPAAQKMFIFVIQCQLSYQPPPCLNHRDILISSSETLSCLRVVWGPIKTLNVSNLVGLRQDLRITFLTSSQVMPKDHTLQTIVMHACMQAC